jgi:hypothetical protein
MRVRVRYRDNQWSRYRDRLLLNRVDQLGPIVAHIADIVANLPGFHFFGRVRPPQIYWQVGRPGWLWQSHR